MPPVYPMSNITITIYPCYICISFFQIPVLFLFVAYKENCLNKKKVTSRKPPVTSHKESPTIPHPKNPADITNNQQKTAIGGSVGAIVFIAIIVVLSLCLRRKGWCRRKVAGAGRVLQRQASGTVTAAGSVGMYYYRRVDE